MALVARAQCCSAPCCKGWPSGCSAPCCKGWVLLPLLQGLAHLSIINRWSTACGKLSKGLPQYHTCLWCCVVIGSTSKPSSKASWQMSLLSSMTTEHPNHLAQAVLPHLPILSEQQFTLAHFTGSDQAQAFTSWAIFLPA